MAERPRRIEWPTLLVGVAVYASWVAVLWAHDPLPWPATVVLLGLTVGWSSSLNHELLHGHPFEQQAWNTIAGSPPLSLHLPFSIYRRDHLAHHASVLTDVDGDPESFYVSAATWRRVGSVGRVFITAHHTLLGRVVLGPLVSMWRLWSGAVREIVSGNLRLAGTWLIHISAAVGIMVFVTRVFSVQWWVYCLGAGYLSQSFILVRSYAEHRWVNPGESPSAVVRSGRLMSLLFLNNNLHHTHHARPRLAWYSLPDAAELLGSDDASAAGAGLYSGYGEIFRRFAVRPFDHPVHPPQRDSVS